MEKRDYPFSELPEALVEEMLSKSEEVGKFLYESFKEIEKSKEDLRRELERRGILRRESELPYPSIPTTCGIDGSFAVEKLLAVDFLACAAVAVEGLTPPSEKRYWEKPHHRVFIAPEKHNPDSSTIIRGLMIKMEIELAYKAPHDIVFLDGSLTSPLIYLNQSINKLLENPETILYDQILNKLDEIFNYYRTILESKRNDKLWVGIPKYTSKRELGELLGWPHNFDDRAVLNTLLYPGEFTLPLPISPPKQPWHLKLPSGEVSLEFERLLKNLHIIYYKPNKWTPALRIEIAGSVARNERALAVLLQGLRYQCGTPGIFEPYPLYIADRMVKHLGKAIPAFRQTATRKMIELHGPDIGDIIFNMHGYRTESNR